MGHSGDQAWTDEVRINKFETWLVRAASGDGLSIKKVLDSPLDLSALPREWNRIYSAWRLHELISECARELPDGDGQIALTALNQFFTVTGPNLVDRFKGLCSDDRPGISIAGRRLTHWRAVAHRWSQVRPELARRIYQELQQRARSGWEDGTSAGADPDEGEIQPFVVDRLEVTYFFNQHKAFTHSATERWLSVELPSTEEKSSIDHYKVRARYTDASDSQAARTTRIEPILNCRRGRTQVGRDGWMMTEMHFPGPAQNGDKVFFASLVRSEGKAATIPLVYIQVTSHGIMNLGMRLQFHPNAVPRACWVYRGSSEPDRGSAPSTEDRDRWLEPSSLGYVEHVAESCAPGLYYAVGWTWD
jgi:hypothetical protein